METLEEEEVGLEATWPPKTKANPYYSVARQRARQRVSAARNCNDTNLRARRLNSALEAGATAGLSYDVLDPVADELKSVEGTVLASQQRVMPDVPLTPSAYKMRPVTPVHLRGALGPVVVPNTVALLIVHDDGMAELRDAAEPQKVVKSCPLPVFNPQMLPPAPFFAMLDKRQEEFRAAFDSDTLRDFLEDIEPFVAIVAVVDPMRPGSQILCSRFLAQGPQGLLSGVVVAAPSAATPPPFSGPSYGALSTLLCVGAEEFGLGGLGWSGGGIFGRCLAFSDRMDAYAGGWPSLKVGALAFRVAESADAVGGCRGSGTYLFPHAPGSPEELEQADSIRSWFLGATRAWQLNEAWKDHFVRSGLLDFESQMGSMWVDSALRAGRWPKEETTPPAAGDEEEEGEGGDAGAPDVEADVADDDEEGEEGKEPVAEAPPAEEVVPEPAPAEEMPLAPSLVTGTPVRKIAVPICGSVVASSLLGAVQTEAPCFDCVPAADLENLQLPRYTEVVAVVDLTDVRVLAKGRLEWSAWAESARIAGGALVAAALLPVQDAEELAWHRLLFAVRSMMEQCDFIIWLQSGVPSSRLEAVLAALLDPAVPLGLMAAHLAPLSQPRCAIAYWGQQGADALSKDLDVGRCLLPPEPGARGTEEDLGALLAETGWDVEEAEQAAAFIGHILGELLDHCGQVDAVAEPAAEEGAGGEERDEEGDGEGEGGDAAGEEAAGDGGDGQGEEPAAAENVEGAEAANAGQSVPLLAFVVGSASAAATMEPAFRASGEQLYDGIDGPSLAYPWCCSINESVVPRGWGTTWGAEPMSAGLKGAEGEQVVCFVVNSRTTAVILQRVLAGMGPPPGAEEPVEEAPPEPPEEEAAAPMPAEDEAADAGGEEEGELEEGAGEEEQDE